MIELSKLKLEETLTNRKENFNKCRIENGIITLSDLIENKKEEILKKETIELNPITESVEIEIAEKETIEFKPKVETVAEKKTKDQESNKESKVVKLDTAPSTTEAARTYTQQFKGGYFGRRKRF